MYEYRLIEFNSDKKEIQLFSNESSLQLVLAEFYKDKFNRIFNKDGSLNGYLTIFVNSNQITSVKDVKLNQNDEICVVSSIAGG
ncbi:putative molybdopterin converting factor 2 (subunit 1) [Legionella busanensis]|uniref:Putative molybdopterin converting factor 2 (Subunit 1) n=1 Tax=Legionella busanensis TaxID=190655 RepID=A0A378K949_9GAMM|nr:MoaD/ThiS family protein [Legionella busanensis]STX81247.1 putative molybdopterin converting factor 2 (subunit 1) [Legionella busanensis]